MFLTLFRIGHISVSMYGVLVALAVMVATWVAARAFREQGLDGDAAWNLLPYALFGGFLGAKLYYLLLSGEPRAFLSRGGFVWYGGLMGGVLAVLWAIRRKGLPLLPSLDGLAPAAAIGHAVGHVGCFFSGDSYGLPSDLPWAVAFPRGMPPSTAGALRAQFGVDIPAAIPDAELMRVHPTMLYSALALFLIFALLRVLARREGPAGRIFGVYLMLAGLERFFVEFVRAKDDRFLWGFTTAQAIAAVSVLSGLGLLLLVRRGRAGRLPAPVPKRPGQGRSVTQAQAPGGPAVQPKPFRSNPDEHRR